MKSVKPAFWIAVALAVLAGNALAGPNGNLEALLRKLPSDCVVVAGTADAPAALAAVRRWTDPLMQQFADGQTSATLTMVLDSVAEVLDGPAVAGMTEDKAVYILIHTGKTQGELLQVFQNMGGSYSLQGDAIGLGGPGGGGPFLQVKDGLIACAPDPALLGGLLSPPAPGEPSLFDLPDAAALLKPEELKEASLFAFKTHWLPDVFGHPGTRGDIALLRRLFNALVVTCHLDAAMAARLQIGEQDLRLVGAAAVPPEVPLGEVGEAGRVPALAEACPAASWGWLPSVDAYVDSVAEGMRAFDPDVAAEFQEEMGELNADLGYNFRQDFLGNLGPGCAQALLPPDGGDEGARLIVYGVKDREKLIRCAEGLARLASAPWQEGEPEDGMRRFSTRVFTIPWELAFDEHRAFLAFSPEALRRGLQLVGEAETIGPTPGTAWEMHTTARVSEVLKSLAGEGLPEDVKVAIAYALQGVRARTDVRRLPERLEFDVRIEGLDPQKLQWFPAPATVGRQP